MFDPYLDELEIDFDKLKSSTLEELQIFVNKCLNSTDSGAEVSEYESSDYESSDYECSNYDADSEGPVVKSSQMDELVFTYL